MNIWLPFDVAAFVVLWWSAASFAHGGAEARDWRGVVLLLSLVAIAAFSLCSVVSLIAQPHPLDWTDRGVAWGCSGVAAWAYDLRFGVATPFRQMRGVLARRNSGGA